MKVKIINEYRIKSPETRAEIRLLAILKTGITNDDIEDILSEVLLEQCDELYKLITIRVRKELGIENMIQLEVVSREDKETIIVYEFDQKSKGDAVYEVDDTDDECVKELIPV
jgi:hypothetical protein